MAHFGSLYVQIQISLLNNSESVKYELISVESDNERKWNKKMKEKSYRCDYIG